MCDPQANETEMGTARFPNNVEGRNFYLEFDPTSVQANECYSVEGAGHFNCHTLSSITES